MIDLTAVAEAEDEDSAVELARVWIETHRTLLQDLDADNRLEFQTVITPKWSSNALVLPSSFVKLLASINAKLVHQYSREFSAIELEQMRREGQGPATHPVYLKAETGPFPLIVENGAAVFQNEIKIGYVTTTERTPEAVALYEDGSPPPNTSELTCISPASAPTLDELNTYPGNSKIFRMGYLLVDYIVENWNRAALVSLIQNNGDIELSFGISQETFESDWLAYVMATYTFDTGGGLSMTRAELLHSFAGNTISNEKYGQSIFMAKDGHFVYGIDGVFQDVGRWWVSDSDELCNEQSTGERFCSHWYKKDESIYRLASNTDCILQDWERTIGDSQGLEQLRQP